MRTVLLASLALAFLAGCSSLPRDSGFEVRTVQAEGRQEPWQNQVIPADAISPRGVAIAVVKWPNPLPREWRSDFVDPARVYEVPAKNGKGFTQKPVVRLVFRANVYAGTVYETTVPAVVSDSPYDSFHVLVPYEAAAVLRGKHLLIPSSDGKWGMTAAGESISLKGLDLTHLPDGFFDQRLPSKVKQVVQLDALSADGKRYLSQIDERFYRSIEVAGRRYLAMEDAITVLAKFTSVEGVSDRLISCTNLKLGPGSVNALPIVAAVYAVQAGIALAKEDCKK